MKKKIVLSFLLVSLAMPAAAAVESGWYVEAGLEQFSAQFDFHKLSNPQDSLHARADGMSVQDSGLTLRGGYRANLDVVVLDVGLRQARTRGGAALSWVEYDPFVVQWDASVEADVVRGVELGLGLPVGSGMVYAAYGRERRDLRAELSWTWVLKSVPPFERLAASGAIWPDGHRESFDAIIWCTGFRPALDHLAPLGLIQDGIIPTYGARAKKCPGLWLHGYGDWTGAASATLIGVGRISREVARQIDEYLA